MPKPQNYPHSKQSVSERVPARFRNHVRHFLTALDRLDTDFEVHCTLYKSSERQPFTLLYTEKHWETRETPQAVVLAPVAVTVSEAETPLPLVETALEPLSPLDRHPFGSQNGFSAELADDWETAPLLSLDHPLTATETTPLTAADSPQTTNGQTASPHPQADWETDSLSAFTVECHSPLTPARRPSTLSEILAEHYGGAVPTGQHPETTALSPQPQTTFSPVETSSDGFGAERDELEPPLTTLPVPAVEAIPPLPADSIPPLPEPLTPPLVADSTPPLTDTRDSAAETLTPTASAAELPFDTVTHSAVETPLEPLATSPLPAVAPLSLGLQDLGRYHLPVPASPVSKPLTTPLQGEQSVSFTPAIVVSELPAGESIEVMTALGIEPPTPVAAPSPIEQEQESELTESETVASTVQSNADSASSPPTPTARPSPPVEQESEAAESTVQSAADSLPGTPTPAARPSPLDKASELTESTVQSAVASLTSPPLLPTETDPPTAVLESELSESAVQGLAAAVMAPTSALPLPVTPTPLPDRATDRTLSAADSVTAPVELTAPSEERARAPAGEGSGSTLPSPSEEHADERLPDLVSLTSPSESSAIAAAQGNGVGLTSPSVAANGTSPRLTADTVLFLPAENVLDRSADAPTLPPSPSVSLVSEHRLNGSAAPSELTTEGVSLPPETEGNGSLETGKETTLSVGEGSEIGSGALTSEGREGEGRHLQQAVVLSYQATFVLPTPEPALRPTERLVGESAASVVRTPETQPETPLTAVNGTVLEGRSEPALSLVAPAAESAPVTFNRTTVLKDEAHTETPPSAIELPHAAPSPAPDSTLDLVDAPLTQGLTSDGAPLLDSVTPLETDPPSQDSTHDSTHNTPNRSAERSRRSPTTAALSTPLGTAPQVEVPIEETAPSAEQQAERPSEAWDSKPLEAESLPVATSEALVPSPATLETAPRVTVEPPDQGFAEDLFVVWRRLALTQSPTVWGVVVSLEDLFTQGFSTWFAPRFIGSLAAAEGVTVTWGCAVQLVNEPDHLSQPRERYQVGGKDVTGITFQSPNARVALLEPLPSVSSLKPLAQPVALPSFSAEPVESAAERGESLRVTASQPPDQATDHPSQQWTAAPQAGGSTPPTRLQETRVDDDDDAPAPPKPGNLWRAGLRRLLGR